MYYYAIQQTSVWKLHVSRLMLRRRKKKLCMKMRKINNEMDCKENRTFIMRTTKNRKNVSYIQLSIFREMESVAQHFKQMKFS